MKKGDCLLLEAEEKRYILILHHKIIEENKGHYGFIIVGDVFMEIPDKEKILSAGVLGYKYFDDYTDLLNSSVRLSQKNDKSVFYTGIRYDMISIQEDFFKVRNNEITTALNLELHPEFYPMPIFFTRQNDYKKICEIIKQRIELKGTVTKINKTVYDAYLVKELLKN